MSDITLKVQKIHPDAIIPSYAHDGDAGMDVVAVGRNITDKFVEYQTGLALEVPQGYVCLIFPRSSITKKHLMLKNSVGVLDSGYRGELILRFSRFGEEIYEVGERIGQIMILSYPKVKIQEMGALSETARGAEGFGSTGK